MNMKRNKVLLLHLLGFCLLISFSLSQNNVNYNPTISTNDNLSNDNLKNSKISGKISINGNSGWTNAKTMGICTGSGTFIDPYLIKDLVINGGGMGSCISIKYSNVYFRIENCSLSNAGFSWGDGGIKLYHIDNGQIINNFVNNNDAIGILLQLCQNISISGNTANSNRAYGICLWYSHYNIISENTFKYNDLGICLETSHKNNITWNNASENNDNGIGIWNSFKNNVSENYLNDNHRGLNLYNSIYNDISGNTIRNNYIGIYITQSQCNDISNNTLISNIIPRNGTQGVCTLPPPSDPPPSGPLPIDPIPIENILLIAIIIGIIIMSTIFLTLIFKRSRRHPRQVIISTEKIREELKTKEAPIRGDSLEPEIKSKLIIPLDLKKIDVIQGDVIPSISDKKPEELEHFEEEIVSVQEEIIEKEQVIEETIVPTEKIVEEEQLLEETVVPPEEILEEEEKIVKYTVEVPKIEIIRCQFCGMELSSDVIFCLRCGQKVRK